MKPLIGLTGTRHAIQLKIPGPPLPAIVVSDDYARGVEQAGGLPFVIPYLEDLENVADVAASIDGLLLTGGDDVSPALFGEEPRLGLGEVTPDRDELEVALFHAVRALGKPVFGICRGMQVINAALGGTLYQDLPRQWRGSLQHSQRAPRNHLSHTIGVEPGSRIYELLGAQDKLRINSFHHQAVKAIAPGMVAVAWDEEGLIEAMESTTDEYILAVQWHPENLWRTQPHFLGLFRGLVEAARTTVK